MLPLFVFSSNQNGRRKRGFEEKAIAEKVSQVCLNCFNVKKNSDW